MARIMHVPFRAILMPAPVIHCGLLRASPRLTVSLGRLTDQPMAEEKRKPPITSASGGIFRRIRNREPFASPPVHELGERMFEALVAAALAKCVEFNVAVNRARKHKDEEFVFVSALRGICEDLISLTYLSRMSVQSRNNLTKLLIRQTVSKGLETQQA